MSRNERRVIANVSGEGTTGQMVIEMSSYERVSRISMPSANLIWTY